MNNRTAFETRRIHHEDPEIHTIVPSGDSKRVILLSSKSRGSDWDLTMVKDEQDSNNGVESEDSGFQLDAADSPSIKIIAPVVSDASSAAADISGAPVEMTVTTKKVSSPSLFFFLLECDWGVSSTFVSVIPTEWDDRD
jgi:hypothetical protein